MPAEPRSRHGLNALKARVKVRGLQAIDGRTAAGRALIDFKNRLFQDLGGEEHVTAQQRALVETTSRTKLFIDDLDAWLLAQPRLVNGRTRAVLPVLTQRQALAESLGRALQALGLERRDPPDPAGLLLKQTLYEESLALVNAIARPRREAVPEGETGPPGHQA